MSKLVDLLGLSHVPRWTTHPVSRPQTVAEHSFRVIVIASAICDKLEMEIRQRLAVMEWAMCHDGPESKTGDLPAPAKALLEQKGEGAWAEMESDACPWMPKYVDTYIRKIVQLADLIEAWSWVFTYGSGLKCKFNGEDLSAQLHGRIIGLLKDDKGMLKMAADVMKELM